MTLIINPGTETQTGTTEENAIKVAGYICEDLSISPEDRWSRSPERDGKGWYGFKFKWAGGAVDVDIPGTDADVVREGRPFKSPRLYVDGSSWLYGYALGFIFDKIKKEIV
jgi:hypothetical protein